MTEHWKALARPLVLLVALAFVGFLGEGAATEVSIPICENWSDTYCVVASSCEQLGAADCFIASGAPPPPNCALEGIACGLSECSDGTPDTDGTPNYIPLDCVFGPGVVN